MLVEKSGMVVNSEKQVIGWVNAGEEADLQDGDTIVSHHKTAEKLGLLEEFKAEKAANAPVKVTNNEGKEKPKRTRSTPIQISEDATYIVLKPDFKAVNEKSVRGDVFRALISNTSIKDYLAVAKDGYEHSKKDGTVVKFDGMTCLRYALKREVIKVNPV